jgi:hypothetical protein
MLSGGVEAACRASIMIYNSTKQAAEAVSKQKSRFQSKENSKNFETGFSEQES